MNKVIHPATIFRLLRGHPRRFSTASPEYGLTRDLSHTQRNTVVLAVLFLSLTKPHTHFFIYLFHQDDVKAVFYAVRKALRETMQSSSKQKYLRRPRETRGALRRKASLARRASGACCGAGEIVLRATSRGGMFPGVAPERGGHAAESCGRRH